MRSTSTAMDDAPDWLRALPKAELHVHLEGTATPELVARLAVRNGMALPPGLLADPATFRFDDFLHFLRQYNAAASCIRTPEDYRDVVFEHLVRSAQEGCLYVELISSPDHARAVGLSEASHREGIFRGIDDAREATGIEARVVVSCVRNLGVEAAEHVALQAAAMPHPYVVGFNMAGDEAGFPPPPFQRAFAIAHEAGLGCTVHAGEHAGPESVRQALSLPGVTRLSHGVRAAEDPVLVAELAERGTVLEVCPTSNVVLGVYGSYAEHPLGALREAGVAVTLASDDPPYFGASVGGEYALAHSELGVDRAGLEEITSTALRAGFLDPATRSELSEHARSAGRAR